jgi:hypothetical protein
MYVISLLLYDCKCSHKRLALFARRCLSGQCTQPVNHIGRPTLISCVISRRVALIVSKLCDVDDLFVVVLATAHKNDAHCLRSHTIPLHSGAFAGCTSLAAANLPNVASIGAYVAHLQRFQPFYARLAMSLCESWQACHTIGCALRCAPTTARSLSTTWIMACIKRLFVSTLCVVCFIAMSMLLFCCACDCSQK